MTSLLGLIETALFSKLTGTPSLVAIVGARIYDTSAPQNAVYPQVVFQHVSGGDSNSSPRRDFTVTYRVEGVSTNHEQAQAISGAIDSALHQQELTIAGWSNYRCEQTDLFNRAEMLSLILYYRKGGFYQISADLNG